MIRSFLRRLEAEDGFSLIELSVSMILSGMVAASLIAVFYSFSQNSGDLSAKANVQSDARMVVAEQVVQLRQAVKADLNGEAIEYLDAGRLAFYTQNYVTGEIERIVYERSSCVAGECELWVYRYAVASSDGITTTFRDTPYEASFVMGHVLSDVALFVGIEYLGDPLTRVETESCSGGACDFAVVAITLRARPHPSTGGAAAPVEIHEEVRIRSV